jgi:hypothetical protein
MLFVRKSGIHVVTVGHPGNFAVDVTEARPEIRNFHYFYVKRGVEFLDATDFNLQTVTETRVIFRNASDSVSV